MSDDVIYEQTVPLCLLFIGFEFWRNLTERAVFARMVISCTVKYKQLPTQTVYSLVQLGPNTVFLTSKPNLQPNCKVLGLVQAKVFAENTRNWISIENLTSEIVDDCSLQRSHSK
jgi:hypothetical protein